MASRWCVVAVAALFAVTAFSARQASAHQPQGVQWEIRKSKTSGRLQEGPTKNGDSRVTIKLSPAYDELREHYLLVLFDESGIDPECRGRPVANLEEVARERGAPIQYVEGWQHPGPRWMIYPKTHAVLIKPGKAASLGLIVDFLESRGREGLNPRLHGRVYEVPADVAKLGRTPDKIAAMVQGDHPLADVFVDLYYMVDPEKAMWTFGGYEDVFGRAMKEGEDGAEAGDYDKDKLMLPVIGTDYQRTLMLPGSFDDDQGEMLRYTLEIIGEYGSGQAGDTHCEEDENFARRYDQKSQAIGPQAVSHTLTGMWSTKWTADHSLHPGFGFRAEAWSNEGGSWRLLASDWVQSNGTWTVYVQDSAEWGGTNLRMLYRSYNQYYAPQNQAGDKYSWKGPDRSSVSTNHNEGHWFADTDGGTYNGVGELVDAAMYMWSRLYWQGGINPVPSSPLRLYFPNTWDNCGGASPWSCADTSGNIWLIAAHGTQANVVVHELSHQLNNKYWDNKRPANSGGSHNLSSCYPTRLGMTLREGFADFMPGWVGYPNRNVAEGGFNAGRWALGYDLESRTAPPNCTNGWEAELWVARVFWDLHDTRADGDDILWFNHKGAVPALYLGNGIANNGDARDMRFYEAIYRAAASSGHEDFITDIFEQNRH